MATVGVRARAALLLLLLPAARRRAAPRSALRAGGRPGCGGRGRGSLARRQANTSALHPGHCAGSCPGTTMRSIGLSRSLRGGRGARLRLNRRSECQEWQVRRGGGRRGGLIRTAGICGEQPADSRGRSRQHMPWRARARRCAGLDRGRCLRGRQRSRRRCRTGRRERRRGAGRPGKGAAARAPAMAPPAAGRPAPSQRARWGPPQAVRPRVRHRVARAAAAAAAACAAPAAAAPRAGRPPARAAAAARGKPPSVAARARAETARLLACAQHGRVRAKRGA